MKFHAKKRIEIILEAPARHRLTSQLDAAGVSGYTVLPVLSGSGRTGAWSREGLVGDAGQMIAVICITDAVRVDALVEKIMVLLARQIGIVSVSDCLVCRGERF